MNPEIHKIQSIQPIPSIQSIDLIISSIQSIHFIIPSFQSNYSFNQPINQPIKEKQLFLVVMWSNIFWAKQKQ